MAEPRGEWADFWITIAIVGSLAGAFSFGTIARGCAEQQARNDSITIHLDEHNRRAEKLGCTLLYVVEWERDGVTGRKTNEVGEPLECPGGFLWECRLPTYHTECWSEKP